jgi:hypothetical protein
VLSQSDHRLGQQLRIGFFDLHSRHALFQKRSQN